MPRTIFLNQTSPEHIAQLSVEQLKSIGTSNAKAEYIHSITDAIISESLDLSSLELLDDSWVIKKLISFKGIGNWTAKMYLFFVLNRPNILQWICFIPQHKNRPTATCPNMTIGLKIPYFMDFLYTYF